MKGVTIKYKSNKGIRILGTRCWVIISIKDSRTLIIMNVQKGDIGKCCGILNMIYIIEICCWERNATVMGENSAQEG